MKFFLKNIVFNKHIKYKKYNIKFLNSIVNFVLQKSFLEVLNVTKPILLDKKNNFNINKFGIKIYSQNDEDGIILYIFKHIGIKTKKFVEIGQKVKKGQTIMIIEAMKTMNHVPSTQDGTVSKILVKDGEPVEFGQPLILVK